MKIVFYLSFIITLLGCSEMGSELLGQNKSTLLSEKGTPKYTHNTENQREYLAYSSGEAYESVQDKIVTHFKNPTQPEKNLQHWMKIWGNEADLEMSTVKDNGSHIRKNQILNKSLNIAIIFNPASNKVERIIHFLPKTAEK